MGKIEDMISQIAFETGYENAIKRMRGVLNDNNVKKAIIAEHGEAVYKAINTQMSYITHREVHNSENIRAIDRILSAIVKSQVGLNISVFMKQQISIINYVTKMPAKSFASYSMKFWKNPLKNYKEISNMDFVKNRTSNIDESIRDAVQSDEYKKFQMNPSWSNFVMLNVKFGDKLAIVYGGWSYYQYLRNEKGMTKEEAEYQLGYESTSTQQSGYRSQKSNFQLQTNSLAKTFMMYSSGPVQAIRQEMLAMKKFKSGQISFGDFAKTMVVYHLMVPMLYSISTSVAGNLAQGEDWDEDDTLAMYVAMTLGPLGSTFAFGRLIQSVVAGLYGAPSYQYVGPLAKVYNDTVKIAKKLENDDMSVEDWLEATWMVTAMYGNATGRIQIPMPMMDAMERQKNILMEATK
jgi:hypothetical protein